MLTKAKHLRNLFILRLHTRVDVISQRVVRMKTDLNVMKHTKYFRIAERNDLEMDNMRQSRQSLLLIRRKL